MVVKLDQLSRIILILTIFLIPILPASFGLGYEQIKILFFILSITLIGFFLVLGKHKLEWDAIKTASAVFILALFVTSILSKDLKTSFLGNYPYFQGWVIYAYLFFFSILLRVFKLRFKWVALALVLSSLIVSFLAIQDWILVSFFNSPVPTYAGRVVSTFGQPNFYSGFLLLTLPFAYYLFKTSQGKLRYFTMAVSLVSLAGIFISYSRTAILLAVVLCLLGLVWQFKAKFKIKLMLFAGLSIAVLIVLSWSLGLIEKELFRPVSTFNPDLTKGSVEKRVYIWPLAFGIALQNPLTGYGLENISTTFSNYFQKNKHSLFEENLNISPVLISFKELNIDRSHNYILDLLLFSGGLGFLAWIFLICLLFYKLQQKYDDRHKNVLLASLVTYLVWIQFQNQSVVHLVYFWLLLGLINQQNHE